MTIASMTTTSCEVCGNEYDKPFVVVMGGVSHTYDSFECAIEALAPRCEHCNLRIIGHGVENGCKMFCSASCAKKEGIRALRDRA